MSLCERQPPLRILLVTHAPGGGVGQHFLDLAQELSARGVAVTGVYSPRKLDNSFRRRLGSDRLPPLHALPMRRAVHPLDVFALLRLVSLVRRTGPFDLVHGHGSKGAALARLAARHLGVPSIYTPHAVVTLDRWIPAWQRWIYGRIERHLARQTSAIIAVSQEEASHLATLGISPQRIHLITNGIRRRTAGPRAEIRASLGLNPGDLAVGFVGRLTHQKAPDILIDSFAQAFGKGSRVRLVMVGSGPLDEAIRRRVDQAGISGRTTLMGDVVASELLPGLDVFCLASRYEGHSYALIEALAAGLPIVSTDVGGARSCVEHQRNGLIIPVEDRDAMARALQTLIENEPLRMRFGAESLKIARQFTLEHMVDQTLRLYGHAVRRSLEEPHG